MRRWDEGAKEPSWATPDFDEYEAMVRRCIIELPAPPG